MRDFCVHFVEIGVSLWDTLETPFSVSPSGNTLEQSDFLASQGYGQKLVKAGLSVLCY